MQPKPAPARLSSACRFVERPHFLSFSDHFFPFCQKKILRLFIKPDGEAEKTEFFYLAHYSNGLLQKKSQHIFTFLKRH